MSGSTRLTPVVDSAYAINSLAFNAAAGAFNLSGNTLTIGGGGIVNRGMTGQTIGNAITLSADQAWAANGNGSLSSKGGVNTNGHGLTLSGSGTFVLQGTIGGTGSVTTSLPGSGIVVDYATGTYTGGTVVAGGELYAPSDSSLGPAGSPLTFTNGGLLFNISGTITQDVTLGPGGGQIGTTLPQYGTLTIAGPIHGPGGLTLHDASSGSYVKLTGHNTYAGGTTLSGVTLVGTTDTLQGNITSGTALAGQVQFQQDTNGAYSGTIASYTGVLKYGAGVVALTGNNTYTGDTQIYTGALEVALGTNNLSPNSRLSFGGGGGVLQVVGGGTFTRTLGSDVVINSLGGFAARNGYLTLNFGGASAPIAFNPILGGGAGQIAFGSPTANSVTELQNPLALGGAITSPAPTIAVTAGTGGDYALLSGVLSGTNDLAKTGTGTLVLSAVNTFAGGLSILGGAVQANDGTTLPAAGPLVLNGGVLLGNGTAAFTRPLGTSYGGQTVVNWSGSGGFAAAGGTLAVNVGGAAAPLTWGGTDFVPNGSALLLGAARASGETVFVNPVNLGAPVREVRVDGGLGGDFAALAGGLSGTGGLNKTGTGQLVLLGAGTYTGPTTVSAGSLVVSGSLAGTAVGVTATGTVGGTGSITGGVAVAGSGTVNLVDGRAGTLTVSAVAANAVALTIGGPAGSPSLLDFEVGTAADRLLVPVGSVAVNPGGGLITITPAAGLHAGTYDLIDFPTGRATGLGLLSLAVLDPNGGYTFSLQQTPTALQLVVVPEPATAALVVAGVAALARRRRR